MSGTVTVNGQEFTWDAKLVDTDYGPEWEVKFSQDGKLVAQRQEPMRPANIVRDFVDAIEMEAIMLENPDMLD